MLVKTAHSNVLNVAVAEKMRPRRYSLKAQAHRAPVNDGLAQTPTSLNVRVTAAKPTFACDATSCPFTLAAN
jgi:hypothetical protein